MSCLYEHRIKNMGNAGRNGGEYYTPRPLIKAMIKTVQPKIGETVYDGAAGSAGFLCEAFEYLRHSGELSSADLETLQKRTFFGKEKKSLAYIIGIMNMMLHGVEAPNIAHVNTLQENIRDLQEKDRFNVVLANPPFGGGERVCLGKALAEPLVVQLEDAHWADPTTLELVELWLDATAAAPSLPWSSPDSRRGAGGHPSLNSFAAPGSGGRVCNDGPNVAAG